MENCDKIQPLLIDFVDRTLPQATATAVSQHLATCKNCSAEVEKLAILFAEMENMKDEQPGEDLRQNFEAMLTDEKHKLKNTKVVGINSQKQTRWLYSPFMQIAAGFTILIAGAMLGFFFAKQTGGNQEVAELKNEMNQMKDMLIMAKLDQPSASERILAANYLEEMTSPDPEILKALINTLNTDKNSNVRQAALNALARFKNEQLVRDAFVETLSVQTDPIIQISLINLLVELQETRAVEKMKQIIQDNSSNESVKKLAEKGVLTLI